MSIEKQYVVSNLSSQSPYTEAYRIARTNLMAYPASLRTIMVTSARSGQGKSTVTTNLGIVTAQMGRRVIIVEADMRRPVLHRFFALSNEKGLAEILKGQATLSEALQPTHVDNLYLLSSGRPPSHPSELLGSRAMRDLLDMMRSQADVIFIDTPPVSAFSDPLILAREVDGVVLAYRARQVPREVDVRARLQLETMQANILGVILTNVEPDVCDSYYYHYTYYEARKREEQRRLAAEAEGRNGSGAAPVPIELEAATPTRGYATGSPGPSNDREEASVAEVASPTAPTVDIPTAQESAPLEPTVTSAEEEEEEVEVITGSTDTTPTRGYATELADESGRASSQRLRLLFMLIFVVVLAGVGFYFVLSLLLRGGK